MEKKIKTRKKKIIALRACVGIERQINKLLIMAMVDLRQSDCLVVVTHVQKPILRHTARGRAAGRGCCTLKVSV